VFEHYANQTFLNKIKNIKLICCDVDGVLTDGGLYYDANGISLKKFNVKDGMAVRMLKENGIETAFVSTDTSKIIFARAAKLNIQHCYIGIWDKLETVNNICNKLELSLNQAAFIGDDLNDLRVIKEVGFSACPADAIEQVKASVDYVCKKKGGEGVLREITELIFYFNQKK